MKGLLLSLMLLASPAFATQDAWPALYDVVGVAQDDALNIRNAPDAASAIVGTLAPDAKNIELIRANDRATWALVNSGEGSGWVSLDYMQRQPGQWLGVVPEIRQCFGTEPFWSLTRAADGSAKWSTPDMERDATLSAGIRSENRLDRFAFSGALHPTSSDTETQGTSGFSLYIRSEACSDGMSDRNFGLSVDFYAHPDGDTVDVLQSGCCSLAP